MATTFGKSSPDDSADESFRDEEEQDIKIEAEDVEVEGKAENKIAKMREEMSACRKDKQEYMDGWQRAKADYVNLLKRIENDTKTSELKGKVQAVETLLPAFDALERAKEHGEIPDGFLAIAKQLESAFSSLGLEEIGNVGEHFDPALHDAFGQDTVDTLEIDNTITVVLEKGWRISSEKLGTNVDTIIRPAKVRVGHFASEQQGV